MLVRMRAASFNRRDQAIATGMYFGRTTTRATIPLSDGAGEVITVGEGVTRFRPGDRVVAGFFQKPADGPPFAPRESLGFPLDGSLAEQMVLYEDGLLPIPGGLSFEEAACLPCAAVTAWNALMVAGRPVPATPAGAGHRRRLDVRAAVARMAGRASLRHRRATRSSIGSNAWAQPRA